MLGCNASGHWPTKFNGGLFTWDPSLTDSSLRYTPDFRNWGGGTMTAQNQRLIYFPLTRSGDFDIQRQQLDFYLHLLRTAELRTKIYWGHGGACFTEQLENFGLPNSAEYGWDMAAGHDKGVEYNAWLEYEWDTVLEFCSMMLDQQLYAGADIHDYLPFIESCTAFFDEHYQYLATKRGRRPLDGEGHIILYPGSGAETYKMAYNPSSTIAGLHTILTRLLALPDTYGNDSTRKAWTAMLKRIPPIPIRFFDGHPTIAPALAWSRINNKECPQLYPVFPWGIYGVGKPGLDTAINTWKYDTDAIRFRSYIGWKQDNIFAARLGLTQEAADLTLKNSPIPDDASPRSGDRDSTGHPISTGAAPALSASRKCFSRQTEKNTPLPRLANRLGCPLQIIRALLHHRRGHPETRQTHRPQGHPRKPPQGRHPSGRAYQYLKIEIRTHPYPRRRYTRMVEIRKPPYQIHPKNIEDIINPYTRLHIRLRSQRKRRNATIRQRKLNLHSIHRRIILIPQPAIKDLGPDHFPQPQPLQPRHLVQKNPLKK
ncbi:hypothetical protein ACQ86N_33055 [Puia sp. P3]|uniref:hypothetical protein n=1 Tax=Puia sp. P3 TaxID=3423952 RepID=UPI003D66C48B